MHSTFDASGQPHAPSLRDRRPRNNAPARVLRPSLSAGGPTILTALRCTQRTASSSPIYAAWRSTGAKDGGGPFVCPDVCAAICGGAQALRSLMAAQFRCTCCATDVDCGHVSMEGGQQCAGQCVDCWADWNQNGIGDCVDPEFRGGICVPPVPSSRRLRNASSRTIPTIARDYALWPRDASY